ncbi:MULTISPECIES: chemotaxis protein [unclassified Haematospirillum]|uniref:chemotaxis protein n=1 Tax=unclassified Haematospirillum TaxID=2622088 RepID=UPI00143A48C3|nr:MULTISPECIES: chemotaxis protein [unclassified Haematospirillum]NKD55200.1 chemotaxis protein [Haematospirillum sp. H4890]NKD75085.1 chemotaxis protein [Haematospirillum sp. H4485]NKD87371.1 chemotaxis protein [Haematospirillum sp. 15-248]
MSTEAATEAAAEIPADAPVVVEHRLEGRAGEMFTQCETALQAFVKLRELSEDMRILSLNAELAAGRAGTAGVAVRALTQYTRQLVSQLNRVQEDMNTLQARAEELVASNNGTSGGEGGEENASSLPVHELSDREREDQEQSAISTISDHAKQISVHAQTIRRIAEQSNGIATNIAIEAAGAGRYEPEFRTVANTMKRYIADLRAMVDDSERAVKQVLESGERLNNARKGN